MNVRTKGHGGEREFCKLIAKNLGIVVERNIDQTRYGGADIVSLPPFAFEVKRQQRILLKQWWAQAVRQVTKDNPVPVLVYRPNRKPWRVLMPQRTLFKKPFCGGKRYKWTPVELDIDSFWRIARVIIEKF